MSLFAFHSQRGDTKCVQVPQQTTEEFQFHYLKIAQIHAFFFRIVRNSACFYDFGFNYGNPDLLYFLKIAPVNYCISSLTRTLISDKTSDSGLVAHSIRCWSGPPPPSFSVRFQADRPKTRQVGEMGIFTLLSVLIQDSASQ